MRLLTETDELPRIGNVRTQQVCLWTAPGVALIMLIAFVAFPGFRPPMSPELPAAEVAAFYADNTAMIRFSMVVYNLCGIMLVPFFTVIVVQMKRMATQSHVFAYCYLTAAVSGATIFALSNMFFLVAAFRPERDPELIMVLNDLAWIVFIAPVGMVVVQNVLLSLAIYFDSGPARVFPRWVGHFSLVTAAAIAPAACAGVVTTGPLAWDGVVSFWLRNIAYTAFVLVMFFVLRAALRRQAAEEADLS